MLRLQPFVWTGTFNQRCYFHILYWCWCEMCELICTNTCIYYDDLVSAASSAWSGHYVSSLLHQHSLPVRVNSQPCLVSVKTCLIRIWSYIEPAVQEKAGGCWWYMCVWFRCDALQIKVIVKCFCIMCMQLEWMWDRLKWFQCCIWLLWNRLWSYRYCRCEAFVRFHTHTVLPSSSLGEKNEIK